MNKKVFYTAQSKYVFTRLFTFFDLLNCSLIKNVYYLNACPILYPMVGDTIFVTIMHKVTASKPAYTSSNSLELGFGQALRSYTFY